MALTPQAQRTLKLFTAVATVGVGVQAMFFSDYNIEGFEGQEHIFTNLQKDTQQWVDQNIYGIDVDALRREQRQQRQQAELDNAAPAPDESKNGVSIQPNSFNFKDKT